MAGNEQREKALPTAVILIAHLFLNASMIVRRLEAEMPSLLLVVGNHSSRCNCNTPTMHLSQWPTQRQLSSLVANLQCCSQILHHRVQQTFVPREDSPHSGASKSIHDKSIICCVVRGRRWKLCHLVTDRRTFHNGWFQTNQAANSRKGWLVQGRRTQFAGWRSASNSNKERHVITTFCRTNFGFLIRGRTKNGSE